MRKLQVSLFIFIFGFLFCIPYNTNALAKEVVSCDYQFTNENGKNIELNYQIFSDGSVGLPFGDGSLFSNDGRAWYHSDKFSDTYYNIAKINNSTITCPSIYVQENDLGVTVYSNPVYRDSCSGHCYNITSSTPKLSKWAKNQGIKSKKVSSTCVGSSMGFYNRKSYVFPYFRLYSDGTKEWSIGGEVYVPVTDSITGSVNGEKFSISVNDSLLDTIYGSSKTTCPASIYRCVSKTDDGYSYELSTSAGYCTNDELSTEDGQAFGSSYYNGAFGDPDSDSSSSSANDNYQPGSVTIDDLREDLNSYDQDAECNSILGSTEDEESVAWLLQQLLNYVKILGPILVVILSSLDFAKAIITSDDENMKKSEKKLVIRLVLAIALFLIPTLVSVLLDTFGITTDAICGLK